jgi:hypothetical protein
MGVTLLCAMGPALILSAHGGPDLGFAATALALVGAGAGWLVGLKVTHHPLLDELGRFANAVRLRLRSATGRPANP